jgi:hypothetical protein
MPTNGGLFQCVLRVSQSQEGQTADFSALSLCGKKSRSWRKGVVPRSFAYELSLLDARCV